ncbi:coiled-coil domain-containing protein 62 isoform X2 [Ambystoma mexicanum]|uniref:coiled-coil domain-containing protein 62 isoform X2 n=1 Tax=Ambystoma mexicanum TaxID=8296 RepID=UPI0037E7C1EC
MNQSLLLSPPPKDLGTDLENSTIQKQRKELQLLIVELKDRDKELNDMVAVHQQQFLAWEDDRQRVLALEQRCGRLENELHQRKQIIRSLTKQIKILESQQNDRRTSLETTQLQLQELSQKALESSSQCQELEVRNQTLGSSVLDLSAQLGRFQAREQELTTMLSLKDKDIVEATNHITEFTGRFRKMEAALRDARMSEVYVTQEVEDLKPRLKALKGEMQRLKEDLMEKTSENNEQREEIIRLKQEHSSLQSELGFAAEREKRKDQLLDLAKSKNERMDTELYNLRQIYLKQQRDLQFLHLNFESSQELMQKHEREMQGMSKDIFDLTPLNLDSAVCCGTSSQRRGPQVSGRLSSTELSLDFNALLVPAHRDFKSSTPQDPSSSTGKLQRLLAESRQMVADLELSASLPSGSCCSSNSSSNESHVVLDGPPNTQSQGVENGEVKPSAFSS